MSYISVKKYEMVKREAGIGESGLINRFQLKNLVVLTDFKKASMLTTLNFTCDQ